MLHRCDFDDINNRKRWNKINHGTGFQAYARSKACLNAFSFRFAKNLAETGISVYAVSPGYFIITNAHRLMRGVYSLLVKIIRPFLQSADRGALNHIMMASEKKYQEQTKNVGKHNTYYTTHKMRALTNPWESKQRQ